jgi:hypothetical protein
MEIPRIALLPGTRESAVVFARQLSRPAAELHSRTTNFERREEKEYVNEITKRQFPH